MFGWVRDRLSRRRWPDPASHLINPGQCIAWLDERQLRKLLAAAEIM